MLFCNDLKIAKGNLVYKKHDKKGALRKAVAPMKVRLPPNISSGDSHTLQGF
jgi:hypothetical protein